MHGLNRFYVNIRDLDTAAVTRQLSGKCLTYDADEQLFSCILNNKITCCSQTSLIDLVLSII